VTGARRSAARRIASGQRVALSRTRRVVDAGALTVLITDSGPDVLSCALVTDPVHPIDPAAVAEAVVATRTSLEGRRVRIELVQCCPAGMAEALQAAGLEVTERPVLLAAAPDELRAPALAEGVRLVLVDSVTRRDQVDAVCAEAFGQAVGSGAPLPPEPALGGSVLALRGDTPVAAASWTAVGEGTSEVVGVATVPAERRRGLGSVVTAGAAAGAASGGADLVWLTPGDNGAQRIYLGLGFGEVGAAVHLAEPDPASETAPPEPAVATGIG
jgi:ribosomal protein S18 acetylase RimI-like enzyme